MRAALRCLHMPVRMKDIAADLGLSMVTISKVLHDHPDIGEQTRQRVLNRVKELRYQPNVAARSLATGRSYLIGLVVPDLLHPFFAEVAKSLARALRKRGYSLIIASSEEDPEIEEQEIEHMVARRLDGLVIAAATTSRAVFDRLDEEHQAYVLIDRGFAGLSANFVGIDDVAAGSLATQHLIERGCARIAHIRGRDDSTGAQRLEGYRKAMNAAGMAVLENYIILRVTVDTESRRQGQEAMERLLALNPRPDGVFCYNDPMAIGAMDAVLAAGLRIPDDIAIIGCGNLHYDDSLRVPLSSIDQQSRTIGERAGKLVVGVVESTTRPRPKRVVLEPQLVERASTARPKAKRPLRKSSTSVSR